jgi:hypothetical protein
MNNVKLVKSLWLSIVISLQVYVLIDEEEKGYMSRVLYSSRKFDDCDGEMVSISHAVGVVSRHMEKIGEENGNGCFKQIAQVSPIVIAVIWSVIIIHEIWTSTLVY